MHYTNHYVSPLGGITLGSDGESLLGLWFNGQKHFAEALSEEHEERDLPIFDTTRRWLDIYFGGGIPDFTPPLVMTGSPFRQSVWQAMLRIPYGQTRTYGKLAAELKKGQSARAVGEAVGHNAISLIIPCHRVVGANGSLTGYAGGIEKKLWLLKLEKVDMAKFFIPKSGTAL